MEAAGAVGPPGPLGTTEAWVLKWACERSIRHERAFCAQTLFGDLALGDMSAQILVEALEVLVDRRYLSESGGGYVVTHRGMDRYVRVHEARYELLRARVARCLVEEKLRTSDAIAAAVDAPRWVVGHALLEFARRGFVRVLAENGTSVRVSVTSPMVRTLFVGRGG